MRLLGNEVVGADGTFMSGRGMWLSGCVLRTRVTGRGWGARDGVLEVERRCNAIECEPGERCKRVWCRIGRGDDVGGCGEGSFKEREGGRGRGNTRRTKQAEPKEWSESWR